MSVNHYLKVKQLYSNKDVKKKKYKALDKSEWVFMFIKKLIHTQKYKIDSFKYVSSLEQWFLT